MSSSTSSPVFEFNNQFKLPIYYNEQKMKLKENIVTDLELIDNIDASSCNPMYSYYFNFDKNEDILQSMLMDQMCVYYTTDTNFLKENQELLKNYSKASSPQYTKQEERKKYKEVLETWENIKTDDGFKERYGYIDWTMWEFLNNSDEFLQIMSIYNMASPVISLCMPIIILIIPFFVIKLKGLNLSISDYIEVLKEIISNHAIGRLFTSFNEVSMQDKMYMVLSAGFYIFTIYQNVLSCIRFNENMKNIHENLQQMNNYLKHTIDSMDNYILCSKDLETESHKKFLHVLCERKQTLIEFHKKINCISAYKWNAKKVFEIGYVLKCFYELYDNKIYHDALLYSFGFNAYVECIRGLCVNIEERKVHYASFSKSKREKTITKSNKIKNNIKKNYYAVLKDQAHVKNNIKLHKNMIITGPNASGKTTVLKSVLINVIFSQQFGCGFYESAHLCPYKHIHCYLNIPDTSGRDSLFQSEARRCKEIIDSINENKRETHFCVFDELYSGTNPDEAVLSATAFMSYLAKHKYVTCMLTTHFYQVCKELDSLKNIQNYQMIVEENTDKDNKKKRIKYTYKIGTGISNIKGGLSVLENMDYPKEIIDKFDV